MVALIAPPEPEPSDRMAEQYLAKERLGGRLRKGDEVAGDWFLEAAHIMPRHKDGPATPDNLRALCRNCHHLIDRLPHEDKVAYLLSLGNR